MSFPRGRHHVPRQTLSSMVHEFMAFDLDNLRIGKSIFCMLLITYIVFYKMTSRI